MTTGLAESNNRWHEYGGACGACFTPTMQSLWSSSKQQASHVWKKDEDNVVEIYGTLHPGLHRSSSKQQDRGRNRQRSFNTSAALSTKTPTLSLRSSNGSDSKGHATSGSVQSYELYDVMTARLSLKVRLLEAEMNESLQLGCVAWTLNATHSL